MQQQFYWRRWRQRWSSDCSVATQSCGMKRNQREILASSESVKCFWHWYYCTRQLPSPTQMSDVGGPSVSVICQISMSYKSTASSLIVGASRPPSGFSRLDSGTRRRRHFIAWTHTVHCDTDLAPITRQWSYLPTAGAARWRHGARRRRQLVDLAVVAQIFI